MSVWTRPMVAAKIAVAQPMMATMSMALGECRKRTWERATTYTPAVTMVAAWINALTGVGPSMASGSQTYKGSWADLPVAPTKSSRQATVSVPYWPMASAGIGAAFANIGTKS